MKWYSGLYVGESVKKDVDKIKWKIIHQAGQIGVCVVAVASNPQNLLEIIPTWELMQRAYIRKDDLEIVGVAKDRDEAVELVVRIVDEVYMQTGTVDVRSYFKEHGRFKKSGGAR
jgi:hypothetical protein